MLLNGRQIAYTYRRRNFIFLNIFIMISMSNSSRKFTGSTLSGRNVSPEWQIEENIRYYSFEKDEVIKARVKELNKEWDIERTVALNASLISFAGIILSAAVNKKWLMLPAVVSALFTREALRGWS